MHGYILSDKEHKPVTEYISWRDTLFQSLSQPYPFFIEKESGTSAKNNLPVFSIYARSIADPSTLERARYFDTLGSYIVYRLTGESRIHVTDACPTGFYLVPNGKLNRNLTDLPVFENLVFPTSVTGVEKAGNCGTANVYVAVGDQQASAYGVGLTEEEYLFNTGTASQLCCLSKDFVEGEFESRPYFNGKTLCTVSSLIGGGMSEEISRYEAMIKEEYRTALSKLPFRSRLIATGGLATYNNELFEKIYLDIVGEYSYINGQCAVEGLRKLARSICK